MSCLIHCDTLLTEMRGTGSSGQGQYEDIALPRNGPPDITTTTPGDGYMDLQVPRRRWVNNSPNVAFWLDEPSR